VLLLFWAGVLWPLSFLPVGDPSTAQIAAAASMFSARSWMLLTAGFIFTALVVSLGIVNERLRHRDSEIESLRAELDPGRYSTFFQVREENGLPIGAASAA